MGQHHLQFKSKPCLKKLCSATRLALVYMLEDRNYMRGSRFDSRFTATVSLLLVNLAVFLVQLALGQFTKFHIEDSFALSIDGLKHGFVWQLITYGFLHSGPLHLICNCWAIYVFGQDVEEALGRKPFLALYFAAVVIGALFQARSEERSCR